MRNKKEMVNFTVSMPTDQGFIGRACNSDKCGRYFKVHANSLKDQLFCPYCGLQFSKNELLTEDQEAYLKQAFIEQAREYVLGQADKMFARLASASSQYKNVTIKHTPINYRAKEVSPNYQEFEVDSELVCPGCSSSFQVFGVFGYCPGCGAENILVYDANLEIIKQEISASSDPVRALRHAYSDVVSTFEQYCKRKAKQITTELARFQILFEARSFFQNQLGIDILDGLTADDLLTIRRLFQKRHLYEHEGDRINEKYVKMIPEDAHLLGQCAQLSIEELVRAADVLRRVLDNLSRAVDRGTNRRK
jgi:Zn finger protein HypA/HybF involved in hydrogenase expression